jgi:hypothetical protein
VRRTVSGSTSSDSARLLATRMVRRRKSLAQQPTRSAAADECFLNKAAAELSDGDLRAATRA